MVGFCGVFSVLSTWYCFRFINHSLVYGLYSTKQAPYLGPVKQISKSFSLTPEKLWRIDLTIKQLVSHIKKGMFPVKPSAGPDQVLDVREFQLLREVSPTRLVVPLSGGELGADPCEHISGFCCFQKFLSDRNYFATCWREAPGAMVTSIVGRVAKLPFFRFWVGPVSGGWLVGSLVFCWFPTLCSCQAYPLEESATRRCVGVTWRCCRTLRAPSAQLDEEVKYLETYFGWACRQCRPHRGWAIAPWPSAPSLPPVAGKPAKRDPERWSLLFGFQTMLRPPPPSTRRSRRLSSENQTWQVLSIFERSVGTPC